MNWWEQPLEDLTPKEWEGLCDFCGLCCLHKLVDEDTEDIEYTTIFCGYLNTQSCQCSVYNERDKFRPDCIPVTIETLMTRGMMPKSCAYRLRYEGKPLPPWHPLLSKNQQGAMQAGVAVAQVGICQKSLPQEGVDYEDYLFEDPIN